MRWALGGLGAAAADLGAPTDFERVSCAGTQPRLRAQELRRARQDPRVELGDRLSAAAQAGDAALVSSLLQQRADPNHVHFAVCSDVPLCRCRSAAVASVLLAHPGIDVNARDVNGSSVLENALLHCGKDEALIGALLSHEKLDVAQGRPLKTAARFASAEVLELLLTHPRVRLNDPAQGALHYALMRTDRGGEAVAELLLAREDLDANLGLAETGSTPLHCLSQMDCLVVEIGQTEKQRRGVVAARQARLLPRLLAHPDLRPLVPDFLGSTALHKAAEAGRADLLELLLRDGRFGACCWHQDCDGRTPLELAIYEHERPRQRWAPVSCIAEHGKAIRLLAAQQRAHLQNLCCPPELRGQMGVWEAVTHFVF